MTSDYDYSTQEYINRAGGRFHVPSMSDEHLKNAIDYVTKQYGHTAAVVAMEGEQHVRKNAGGSGYLSPKPNPLITATAPRWAAPWDTTRALGRSAMKRNFGDMRTGPKVHV